MLRRLALAPFAALLAAGCSPTALLNALAPERGVQLTDGIPYGEGPRNRIDVHAPRGANGAPAVVFFYGGSWETGDRGMYRFLGAALAAAGVVCMIPDYRVWPAAGFPGFMQDGARAVAWARAHAAEHGGDPRRLFLMGHSAGAQIATLLALDAGFLPSLGVRPGRDLRGVIGLAGPYDFLPLRDPTLQAIFGAERDWPASQPINHVTAGAPPMLLATGDADTVVLPRNSESLAARLRAAGNAAETITYPGIGHSEIIGAFAGALTFLAPVRRDVLRFVAERAAA